MNDADNTSAGEADETVDVTEQRDDIERFLSGLVQAMGVDASVDAQIVDDAVHSSIDGTQVGLLIGPQGGTLRAIQELTRTVVQRRSQGNYDGRVTVDVANYWERRRSALEEFAVKVAQEVATSGTAKSLEPMGSADRKIVHDAIMAVEGVMTTSEGEEPRRRVVVRPDAT